MKCIALLIKPLLVTCLIFLVACSGKTVKTSAQSVSSGGGVPLAAKKISSPVKRDYDQALVYMQNSNYLQAERVFKRIISVEASLAGPYINLGIIRLKEGNLDEAERQFLLAKERNGSNAEVYNYLGIIYRQQGRFQEAESAYKRAIKQKPKFAKAYLNLGVLYDLYLGDYPAALKNYKQYEQFEPNDKRVKGWIIDLGQRMQASNL